MARKKEKQIKRVLKGFKVKCSDRNIKAQQKAQAEFVKVTETKAKQEYYDYITKEVVNVGKELNALWLQTKDTEAEIKMKYEQVNSHKILELYNGMPKTEEKVITEFMILEHNMNMMIYKINKHKDRLVELNFSEQEIKDMINGKFDYAAWHKSRDLRNLNKKLDTVQCENNEKKE